MSMNCLAWFLWFVALSVSSEQREWAYLPGLRQMENSELRMCVPRAKLMVLSE